MEFPSWWTSRHRFRGSAGGSLNHLLRFVPWAGAPKAAGRIGDLFDRVLSDERVLSWHEAATLAQKWSKEIGRERAGLSLDDPLREVLVELNQSVRTVSELASSVIADAEHLAARSRELGDLEWAFLYDPRRRLLAVGYDVPGRRLENSFYDLLASEARMASFVAIAQGKLPEEHWFALGRQLTSLGGRPALLSWSGSIFEYLMPVPDHANVPPYAPRRHLSRSREASG